MPRFSLALPGFARQERRWLQSALAIAFLLFASRAHLESPQPVFGERPEAVPTATISAPWKLLSFGAEWSTLGGKLRPELARVQAEHPSVTVILIDVDQPESDLYRRYFRRYYKGRSLPLTVLVSPSGKAVREWTGFFPYSTMVQDILDLEPTE